MAGNNTKLIRLSLPVALKNLKAQPQRVFFAVLSVLIVLTEIIPILTPHIGAHSYALGTSAGLLPQSEQSLASKLVLDSKNGTFDFNAGYNPQAKPNGLGGALITATVAQDPSKGINVVDPTSSINLKVTPEFSLFSGQKQDNRVVYPIVDGSGWLVYTMLAGEVKEDLLLNHSHSDSQTYRYKLDLAAQDLAAHLEPDGSIGIYGSTLLSGNVSTGTANDAKLLAKARQNAPKDKLLFIIPKPVINENDRTKSSVKASYQLNGEEVSVVVQGLTQANYPIAIDPSVYVTSAQQFMQGNNETSIDFDTSGDQIQKGKITGARLDTSSSSTGWTTDLALNASRWSAGYATGGGYEYVVGGLSGSTAQNSVYWAQFNPTANTMNTPPNPGTGSAGCNSSNWCTNSAYNLPNNRSGLSSLVYNGYLYAIGGFGSDAACAGGNNVCNSVYSAKLGANGEPISWTTLGTLNTAVAFAGAVAYNNHIYVAGGQTTGSLNGTTVVQSALVNPDGTLGTWTTTGMTAIPTAGRWGETLLQYNGYIYLVGGASTTTAAATVQYIKINSDGTLASAWVSTTSFNNARMAFGGNFATVYGGYLYITTGCTTLTTSACSTFTSQTFTNVTTTVCGASHTFDTQSDFQYASINADGSITAFTISARNPFSCQVLNGTPLSSASSTAMTGYGLTAWRGALYAFGGCTAVSTATNCSGTTQTQATYGVLYDDGNISPIYGSLDSNFFNGTNYLYDLPTAGTAAGQGGRMTGGAVINNGFIYYVGGCVSGTGFCTTTSNHISYAAINSDGTLAAPGTCSGTTGSTIWCVDSTNTLPAAVAAMGITVYDNVIYTAGGFTGAANTRNGAHVALSSNGSLAGAWTTDTNILPTGGYAYDFMFGRAEPGSSTLSYIYIIGGCIGSSGIGCSSYTSNVTRCEITNGAGYTGASGFQCATTSQLQLFTGTGIMGGAVYGDYIYLAGGANSLSGGNTSPTGTTCTLDANSCGGQLDIVQYATFNSSGSIVRADNGNATGGWQVASSRMTEERRRTTAVAMNGYLYVIAGHDGNTPATLNDIQRGKINVSTGDVTSFTKLSTTITYRWDDRAVAANGYIYVLGGCTNGDPPASCSNTGGTALSGANEYIQVYNNWSAAPASYTSSGNTFGTDRYDAGVAVLNGYLYIAGGCTSTADCDVAVSSTTNTTDVSYSKIANDGSIGSWTAATGTGLLPAARTGGALQTVGGALYYIGGQTAPAGTAQTTVYYDTPNTSTGVPNAWTTSAVALPVAKSQMGSAVYNNRIYIGGGYSGSNLTETATVYYSSDQSAGGDIASWTSTTSFNTVRANTSMVAYGNNLYIIGGDNATPTYMMDVQYAPINSNGTIGTFAYGTSLPQLVGGGSAFASNGFLYLFGGRSALSTCTNNTYDAPINADGSIGNWSQTSTVYTTAREALSSVYYNGRAYLLGGQCGGTKTGANNSVYGTLQIQPQLAQYSLEINTDTDVFPAKYLMNGLDNGIGASWFLNYQSSTSANDSWGLNTNAGKLSLGTPGTYTPLDGSGTNTNATVGARYYFLFLKIDDQQAFGFPEDVTRGPTIRDITLEFTSNPGKRLRNGKTFTGGVQQPLDTPF